MVPKWIPVQKDGKTVRTKYLIYVDFPPNSAFINIDSTEIKSNSDTLFDRAYSIGLLKHSSSEEFSDYSLYFSLCKNGNYEISVSEKYNNTFIIGFSISDGIYEIINDTLIFTDSFTHHQLLYLIDSICLRPIITFPFMKEIVFRDYSNYCHIEKNSIYKKNTIEKIISDFEETNIQINHFEEGNYRYDMLGIRFELKLKEDNNYEFNFKVMDNQLFSSKAELYLVFSTGTWERNGNILTLWDTNLQHQFYGLIWENGIEFLMLRVKDLILERKWY
jgi:hypothetical protein